MGHCHCFTHDAEHLHWKFQKYLTDERQQSAAHGQYRSHDGREARTNTTVNQNTIALPPTSYSPTVKPPRVSSDDNSPSTWDNAAVSRGDNIRSESQHSISLQTISASNSSPTENRTSTFAASAVERRSESQCVAADARLQVIPPSIDARATPWRTTAASPSAAVYDTTVIYRGSAGSGSLDQQTTRSAVPNLPTEQPWHSTSPSLPWPLQDDTGSGRDLRRDLGPGRNINSRDRNVTLGAPEQCSSQSENQTQSQTQSQTIAVDAHNRHEHPRRPSVSCDASVHRSREEQKPEQPLAVNTGTSSSASSGHDRDIIIRPWKSISMLRKKTGKDEQRSFTRSRVQPPTTNMIPAPSSDPQSLPAVSASIPMQFSPLLNATGIGRGNIPSTMSSICRSLASLHVSRNCIGRVVRHNQKRNDISSLLDNSIGAWLLIWTGCLLFSALFRGIFTPMGANPLIVMSGIF